MESSFPKELEETVRNAARPHLLKGRPGDWEHTLRVVEHARLLLRDEGGDAAFVLPALYLHDVGWSLIDYSAFLTTPFERQEESRAAILHQQRGAELAVRILAELGFDQPLAARIEQYIRVHDQPEAVYGLNCHEALLCFEADRLDRYGRAGEARLDGIFAGFQPNERRRFLEEGVRRWFRTSTGRRLALQLLRAQTRTGEAGA